MSHVLESTGLRIPVESWQHQQRHEHKDPPKDRQRAEVGLEPKTQNVVGVIVVTQLLNVHILFIFLPAGSRVVRLRTCTRELYLIGLEELIEVVLLHETLLLDDLLDFLLALGAVRAAAEAALEATADRWKDFFVGSVLQWVQLRYRHFCFVDLFEELRGFRLTSSSSRA